MNVSTDEDFDHMIEEYLINRVARMETGDVTHFEGLFHPALLRHLTELERKYQFEPTIEMLIGDGVLNLEIAVCDDDGRPLFRVT